MKKTSIDSMTNFLRKRRPLLRGTILEYIFVTAVLTVITAFVMNGVILSPDKKIFTSAIGDATSGFTWIMSADKDWNPAWAHTDLINYPYGQDLWSPVYVAWTLVMAPMWLLSKFMSPIAALTVMTMIGYVSSGFAGYALIKRITNRWDVSFFAAYGMAFMPYHVMKSSDHLTNVFSWVFVAIIASMIAYWRKQTLIRGLLLALSVAAACYTDGYFIFISGVLLLALTIALVATDGIQGINYRTIAVKLVSLLAAAGATIILLIPMLYVQVTTRDELEQDLGNARENVKLEVGYYGAKPIDFLLPPYKNPIVGELDWYERALEVKNRRSNNAESTNYIGYVVLVLMAVGVFWAARTALRARRKKQQLSIQAYIFICCVVASPLVLVWMLPPTINIFGIQAKMPMGYLVEVAPYWRVPARVFLALQPLTTIAASISLWALTMKIGRKNHTRAMVLVLALTLVLAIEFASGVNRPSFSTDRMPNTYSWLAKQESVKAIAEVPIVDRPIEIAGYYVFAQMIHGKPIINTSLSKTAIGLFNPLGDINNPETINFIKARGVDTVVTHEPSCVSVSWGRLLRDEPNTLAPPYTGTFRTHTCVYALNDNIPDDNLFVFAKSGFSKTNYMDDSGTYWSAMDKDVVTVESVNDEGKPTRAGQARFEAATGTLGEFTKRAVSWRILQDGRLVSQGSGGEGPVKISADIDASKPFSIEVRLNGNQKPAPGEIGFSSMQIIEKR